MSYMIVPYGSHLEEMFHPLWLIPDESIQLPHFGGVPHDLVDYLRKPFVWTPEGVAAP